jgi:hypothetical protein
LKSVSLALLLALASTSVSGCWLRRAPTPPAPQFAAPPTQQNLVDRINSAARIRQLQAESATISMRGLLLPLRANLALEHPRRLRLRGEVLGAGGVDLGSNEELFWLWTSLERPPVVRYARHEEFQRSAAAEMFPFRPEWLIEALGVVSLDPSQGVEGPYARGAGQLELRTRVPGLGGELTKVIVVDASYGWILQQYLYDPRGELLAQSTSSEHRYYAQHDVSLPHRVEIQLPRSGASLRIDVAGYLINQLHGDPEQLWSMPQIAGAAAVDITDPRNSPLAGGLFQGAPAAPASDGAPPAAYGAAPTAARPQYRGFPGR